MFERQRRPSDGAPGSDIVLITGARIELSAQGSTRHPRYVQRLGTVVGQCRNPGSVRVVWDGSTSPIAMHKHYLRAVPNE